jgi:hypothetical protein
MWHARERREIRTEFWWGNLKEIGSFEDRDVDERILIKFILNM